MISKRGIPWRLVVSGAAAAAVVAGGVLGAVRLNPSSSESSVPNVDTRTWSSQHGSDGWIFRHPSDWFYEEFGRISTDFHVGGDVGVVSNDVRSIPREGSMRRLGRVVVAVRLERTSDRSGRSAAPETKFPLALEHGIGRHDEGYGDSVELPLILRGRPAGRLSVWIGDLAEPLDAEIARRIVSSIAFEDEGLARVAATVAERDRRIAPRLSGVDFRLVGHRRAPETGECAQPPGCTEVQLYLYETRVLLAVRVRGDHAVDFTETRTRGPALSLEERIIAHEIAESDAGARRALKGRPHTHTEFAIEALKPSPCDAHRCGVVVFQITGGLRFHVLVDLNTLAAVKERLPFDDADEQPAGGEMLGDRVS